jgi:FKBP-type peptidyl-prolyl cis-trans isomerase (trigger factor)
MIRWLAKIFHLIGSLLMIIALAGCSDSEPDIENEYLIRIGNRIVTVLDFKEAFEITKAAYPHDIRNNREEIQKAQLRLLNQMTIELIVLERAKAQGIVISDAEVEQAVAEIKSDYPEGVFEETLLEFAVSYKTWEDRLRTRLIMEKVIDKELKDQIVITPEDVASYYEQNYKDQKQDFDISKNSNDINEAIIEILRRKKVEDAYDPWLRELKSHYKIEINSAQWENISGTKNISAKDLKIGKPNDQ